MDKKHVFVIGEIGINASGNLDIAKQLIQGAKDCGADAVKFQKRTIEKVYSKEELEKPRESPWGTINRQQKEGLEFGKKEYDEIDKFCKKIDIQWFASPWDLESVEFLKQYDLKYNKIASAMLQHKQLLRAVAIQQKYTFISTGMATLNDIQNVVYTFKRYDCPFELMHCCSTYPMELEDSNLTFIGRLKEIFGCDVGFSDHYPGIITAIIAVALGATSIEKHITLDRSSYGSDQAASMELVGFERMVKYIRAVPLTLGDGIKRISEKEEIIKKKLARTSDYNA